MDEGSFLVGVEPAEGETAVTIVVARVGWVDAIAV